jgi:hypothetical protein
MSLPKKIKGTCWQGYQLWKRKGSNETFRLDIMERGIERLDWMFTKTSKVMPVRFILRLPKGIGYMESDKLLSSFTRRLTDHYRRKGIRVQWIWCREQENSESPHWHFILWLDGQDTMSAYNHHKKVDELWSKVLGLPAISLGLVDYCNRKTYNGFSPNGTMLHRGDEREYAEMVRLISYLAKTDTKESKPKDIHAFGKSQLTESNS